jgi:hypothetical protein
MAWVLQYFFYFPSYSKRLSMARRSLRALVKEPAYSIVVVGALAGTGVAQIGFYFLAESMAIR